MGQLVDGVWRTGWYEPDAKGAFQRPEARFRNRDILAEPGRYHLYVSYACPWAHRTLITRALRGLEAAVSVTIVDPKMPDEGWVFGDERLQDVYVRAAPKYTGRVTVPVLWDKQANTIVNNESREVMRMLDTSPMATGETLAPEALVPEIERVLDAIYAPINNGVYRCGFAGTQEAYDHAVRTLFDALYEWERALESQPFLCGDRMTEADIAMFTTLLRFDLVYYAHFKTNERRLRDLPNLWRFTRRMYQHPAIKPTCRLDHIKVHYYWSQSTVNPTRIVPIGPDLEADLDR
ncbi:MAG: glutathione S-transferase C-terminal domain-containing protein [Myxococcota bacterium]|nr:glutathione S-transferase C-terminal domain-containing protein [Myxococcota bacterium]